MWNTARLQRRGTRWKKCTIWMLLAPLSLAILGLLSTGKVKSPYWGNNYLVLEDVSLVKENILITTTKLQTENETKTQNNDEIQDTKIKIQYTSKTILAKSQLQSSTIFPTHHPTLTGYARWNLMSPIAPRIRGWRWVAMDDPLQGILQSELNDPDHPCRYGARGFAGGWQQSGGGCPLSEMVHAQFKLDSGRRLFSMADVVERVRKSQREILPPHSRENGEELNGLPRYRTVISIIGDSVSAQLYHSARCQLLRMDPTLHTVFTQNHAWTAATRPSSYRHANNGFTQAILATRAFMEQYRNLNRTLFNNSTTTLDEFDFEGALELILLINYRPYSLASLRAMCARSHVILLGWGVHWNWNPNDSKNLRESMRGVARELKSSCAFLHHRPVIISIGALAQHFAGEKTGGMFTGKKQNWCPPLTSKRLDNLEKDSYGNSIYNFRNLITEEAFEYEGWQIKHTPWDAKSPNEVCGTNTSSPTLHMIPSYEITLPMWPNHVYHDCTHFCYAPKNVEPFWDAIYLAVLAEAPSLKQRRECVNAATDSYEAVRGPLPQFQERTFAYDTDPEMLALAVGNITAKAILSKRHSKHPPPGHFLYLSSKSLDLVKDYLVLDGT